MLCRRFFGGFTSSKHPDSVTSFADIRVRNAGTTQVIPIQTHGRSITPTMAYNISGSKVNVDARSGKATNYAK